MLQRALQTGEDRAEELFVNILKRSTWLTHVSASGRLMSAPSTRRESQESGCFSPFWRDPTYRESQQLPARVQGTPRLKKKKKKAAQMFPLSVLLREAAAFVLRSAFLADKSGMQGRPVSGGLCPQTSDPLARLPVGRAASRGVISQTLHYVACVALAEFLCLSELLFFIYEWARGQGSQILKLSIYEELFVLNKSV